MRRRRHEEIENHERWLVSYADFITLLFAFFVVMYAIGQQDIRKAESFEKSIRKQFNILVAQVKAGAGGSGAVAAKGLAALANPNAGPNELGAAIQSFLEGEMSERERNEAIESLRADSNGVRMSLRSDRYFQGGSFRLRSEAIPALRRIGEILEASRRTIIIEGHAERQETAIGKSSWDVAALRANQILSYFLREHQLSSQRIVSISYGGSRPIGSKGDQRNERIEILIVTEDLML